jgi:hypothetical protein
MKLRNIRLFGVRYALNLVIDWVNCHEVQSQETLAFRDSASERLYDQDQRLHSIEERLDAVERRRK